MGGARFSQNTGSNSAHSEFCTSEPLSRRLSLLHTPYAELVANSNGFSRGKVNLDHFLAVDFTSCLVAECSDDFLGLRVDHFPRRGISPAPIQAESDPARFFAQCD